MDTWAERHRQLRLFISSTFIDMNGERDALTRIFPQIKELCDKQEEQIQPKITEIKNKMKDMEKELNSELFAKYKELKADLGVPVFVPIDNGHCARCRVELPTAKLNKLKADGTIVCGECHRVIFNK